MKNLQAKLPALPAGIPAILFPALFHHRGNVVAV